MVDLKILIPLTPITKKNHMEILVNRKTGRPFIAQSKQYKYYEKEAMWFIKYKNLNISEPVNIKYLFYMPTRRRVDLLNLEAAADDILTKAGVIADDNSNIVVGHDGSRVFYDKARPRTEIYITSAEETE